jgi:putative transcriptional regulator
MNEVKALRKKTGLTQAAFAERYGIPKRTIENWEGKKSNPPGYVLAMLTRLVEIDENEKA